MKIVRLSLIRNNNFKEIVSYCNNNNKKKLLLTVFIGKNIFLFFTIISDNTSYTCIRMIILYNITTLLRRIKARMQDLKSFFFARVKSL